MKDKNKCSKKRKAGTSDASERPGKRSVDEDASHAKPAAAVMSNAPSNSTVDKVPAQVWGHVMDYLPYTDVLRCLSLNKLLSFEAPTFVKKLHIFKSCELELLPLFRTHRRFENVIEININCLITEVSHWTSDHPTHKLCVDAVNKIVPFLEAFPKLVICWLGGFDEELGMYQWYNGKDCIGPEDHAEQHRKLITYFCDAFERGSLSQSLILEYFVILCEENVVDCDFCKRVCSNFPLSSLLKLYYTWNATCFIDKELCAKITERKWDAMNLRQASHSYISAETLTLNRVSVSSESCRKELKRRSAVDPGHVYFLPEVQKKRIQFMIDYGLVIGAWVEGLGPLTKDFVLDQLQNCESDEDRGYALAKSTFDLLIGAGYPLDSEDFVVVDETRDESLEQQIRDEDITIEKEEEDDGENEIPQIGEE